MPSINIFSTLSGIALPGFFLLLISPSAAHALPTDRQEPISIEADRAQINEKTGVTIYQGSVVTQQGSMLIKADKVTIYSTDGRASKIICTGTPAHYQQQPKIDGGLVTANADTIEYHLDKDTITLIKNASLIQEGSTLKGDHINYNVKAEFVEARGNSNNKQRVQMVLPPKPQKDSH